MTLIAMSPFAVQNMMVSGRIIPEKDVRATGSGNGIPYNLMVSTRATRTKNSCASACGRLTSGNLRIVSEACAGSSENTMKLHTTDGLTQVGYAKQRLTVLVGAVCDYLDLIFLPIAYLFSSLPLSPYLKRSEIC